jgi:hypothetical protein
MAKKREKAASSAKAAASDTKADENEPKTSITFEAEPASDSSGTRSHLYRDGRAAVGRIRSCRDWEDWVKVARAVDEARSEAMKIAGTNAPLGSRYYKAFGEVLKREVLHTDKLDSAIRNLLFKVIKHLAAIEEWRQKLDLKRRGEMNFPRVVLNNWGKTPEGRAALNPPKPGDEPKPPPKRQRNHAELVNENVELEERVERLTDERNQLKREVTAGFTEATAFAALISLGHTLQLRDLPRDVQTSDLLDLAERIRQLAAEVEAMRAEETVH